MADAKAPSKNSDLPVRLASAIVMVAIAGTALWLGGWVWTAFVALVGLGVFWEWSRLAFAITEKLAARAAWLIGGVLYIGTACYILSLLRDDNGEPNSGLILPVLIIVAVIAVDVGAYFAGRAIGGPKIAPSISPSKTWAGLIGGGILATLIVATLHYFFFLDVPLVDSTWLGSLGWTWPVGFGVAIAAQAGDFFESWMKRKAGVKDSSNLIPGHGGLFDRMDGLIAVCFVFGVWFHTFANLST